MRMLRRENDLRLSSEIQAEYTLYQNEGFAGFVRVTEKLQKQVVEEFGLGEEEGLQVILPPISPSTIFIFTSSWSVGLKVWPMPVQVSKGSRRDLQPIFVSQIQSIGERSPLLWQSGTKY
jgi:hypothetical protein